MIGFRLLGINKLKAAIANVLRLGLANTGDPNNAFYKYDAASTSFKRTGNMPGSSNASDIAISPDANYMCIAISVSPYIVLYKMVSGNWTQIANPSTLPAGVTTCCAFSRNGNYLAVGHYTAPFLTVYKRSGDTFTKIPDMATALNQRVQACHFSPISDHLVIAGLFSPYGAITFVSDTGMTAIQSPSPVPWYYSYGCRFSPKGDLVAVVSQTSPYYFIYKFDAVNGTFGQRITTGEAAGANPRAIVFGPNSDFFYVCGTTEPYMTGFKLGASAVGDKLTVPAFLTSYAIDMDISKDGQYIGVAHYGGPFITVLQKSGDTLTPLPAVDQSATNNAAGIQFYYTSD